MKKRSIIATILAAVVSMSACRKLDVDVESQYVDGTFPLTQADYTALLGSMYANLASSYAIAYWRMQELSTDEAIIPARDGNFDDGGQYRQLHYHSWTFDHPNVTGVWQWGFGGINNCGRLINVTQEFYKNDPASKQAYTAEIRAVRALYYFFMMDTYGNIPIISSYPVPTPPETKPRAEVFRFIEAELKDVVQQLPAKSANGADNTLRYGRPTKEMVFALLAKMYLNASIYTGVDRKQDVVAMADSIQKNTNYFLDGRYRDIFLPNNGPQINETIFAIPYDQQIPGNQFTRFGFYYYLATAYGMNVGLSIAMSTTPEFYDRFYLPGDDRNKTWLIGKQFAPDGNGGFTTTPVYYPNSTTQIEIFKPLILKPGKPMDLGNDQFAQASGVRSIKYYPDVLITQATRLNGNDVPVFRLADVYLMKAEALLRGATPSVVNGMLQTPDYLVNLVRTRAHAPQVTGIVLDSIPNERARELSWEGWRRNDLIRFGLFEKDYPLPNDNLSMNKDITRRLYPIPITEIRLNTKLKQNDGYGQ